jgi:hypothetical protein
VPDLVQFVADASQMPHPTQGYVVPSQTRTANFQALLKAVFQAGDTMLAGRVRRGQVASLSTSSRIEAWAHSMLTTSARRSKLPGGLKPAVTRRTI